MAAKNKPRFSKKMIYEKSIKLIKEKGLLFIDDISSLIPCHKTTFYKYIQVNSPEHKKIQTLLDENKIKTKVAIRKKWYDSDQFNAQLALYKLCGTREERKALSNNPHEPEDKKVKIVSFKFEEVGKENDNEK